MYGSNASLGPTLANFQLGEPETVVPNQLPVALFGNSARMPLMSGLSTTSTIEPFCL